MDVKKEKKAHHSSSSTTSSKDKDKDKESSSSSHHHHHHSSSTSSSSASMSRKKTSRRSPSPTGSSDDDHRSHRSSHHSSHRDRDDKDKSAAANSSSSRKKRHNDENHGSESATKKQKNSADSTKDTSFEGGEKLELSIEETNKLREKLGLKPLQIDNKDQQKTTTNNVSAEGNRIYHDKKTDETFEHVPAKNLSSIKEEKSIRDKLNEQREKRKQQERIESVKALGESDEETDDSAQKWVEQLMKKQEKEQAAKKEKMLEDMDHEYGVNAAKSVDVETKIKKEKEKLNKYGSKDLSGMKVEHSQEHFREGQSIVLTLKDKGVLDENEEDVLINVNIADDEKAAKNIENKKKKPTYNPYDDFDEFGMWRDKNILDKYDEELDGEKKKSFKLGSGGVYDTSIDRFINEQNEEYKSRAIKLDLNDIKFASDYMTKEEMETFKKPKKLRKKLRKTVKADDLLPLDEIEQATSNGDEKNTNYGSRKTQQHQQNGENGEEQKAATGDAAKQKEKISLKDLDFELNKSKNESENEDDDEIRLENIDDQPIDDEAFDELHTVLERIRKKTVKTNISQIAASIIPEREDNEEEKQELERKNSMNDEEDEAQRTITLDITSEFCKNLGDIPSYNRRQMAKDDEYREVDEYMKKNGEEEEEDNEMDRNSEEMDVDGSKKGSEDEEEGEEVKPVFDDEPVIDRGLASAIRLAVNKGYLSEEKTLQNARLTRAADSITAKHYMVEEKSFYDIDDKYTRNRGGGGGGGADRYSGPLTDFKEKEGYKPNVKLEYVDETGHNMNEKEAFRQLSHRFHGKGSGKRKTEKRNKKIKESELEKKMSSIDTPLNTVALLIEKQKKLQQPFVVLSAPKGERIDHITLNKP